MSGPIRRAAGSTQPSPSYCVNMTADPADVDAQGHISNLAYVRWIQEVAEQHSAAVGFPAAAYERLGTLFLVRRHEVDYMRPAYAGDPLVLETQVLWWRGAQCERETRIVHVGREELLARARTFWVYVSRASGKPRRIPLQVETAFYSELP